MAPHCVTIITRMQGSAGEVARLNHVSEYWSWKFETLKLSFLLTDNNHM